MQFGQVACSLGLISYNQVIQALWVQKLKSLFRSHRPPLGSVLVQLGHLTEQDVESILAFQRDEQYQRFIRLHFPHFAPQKGPSS
jgi:hypothetical protein